MLLDVEADLDCDLVVVPGSYEADPLAGSTEKDGLGMPFDNEDDLDCDLVDVPGS